MLASAGAIEVVADAFREYNVATTIVDPVRYTYRNSSKIRLLKQPIIYLG
jgi:hydroxymethylpyrimidine/phosphomethylpyrimidine kinase